MNSKWILVAVACVIVSPALAAQEDGSPQLLPPIVTVGGQQKGEKDPGKQADKDKKKQPDAAPPDVFSNLLVPRGEARAGFNPNMMGDFQGIFVRQTITIFGTQTITTVVPNMEGPPTIITTTVPTTQTREILIQYAGRGGYKVGENASPRPQDRVFGIYHYFNGIRSPDQGPTTPTQTSTTTTTTNGGDRIVTTTNVSTIPGQPFVNMQREVIGFEKTFLDGFASVEVRIPVVQQASGLGQGDSSSVGDMTIIGKYAWILDRDTGDVFSGGLAVTVPNGPGLDTPAGHLHSTLLQPWFGYIWNADRFFLQGFHSVVFPTDSRDVTLLFNDIGVGYWLYRGDASRMLSFIVPAIEAHITTPLTHRDGLGLVSVPDIVNMTGGLHLGLFRNATLSVGVATPVTGPRPVGVEAFAQFNLRF